MPSQSKSRAQQSTAIALPRGTVIVYAVVALISLAGLADATYLTAKSRWRNSGLPWFPGLFPSARQRLREDCRQSQPSVRSLILPCFTFATFAAFGYQRARTFLAVTVFMMFLSTPSVAIALLGSNHIFADRLDRRDTRGALSSEVPWIFGRYCRIF